MLRSMTGFGRSAGSLGNYMATVEIKAVNHRHCEVKPHFPRNLSMLEHPTVGHVKRSVHRGRLELFLRLARNPDAAPSIMIDKGVLTEITRQAHELSGALGLDENLSLAALLQLPGVITSEDVSEDEEELWSQLAPILDEAVKSLLESKAREGQALADELLERVKTLEALVEEIDTHRHRVVEEYRDKLAERIRNLTEGMELDQARLATEVALLADRGDITEEVVRFRAHMKRFVEMIEGAIGKKGYRATGRDLDFVIQEMFREANTMTSKSSAMEIINPGLKLKGEVEKLREQVQNVE